MKKPLAQRKQRRNYLSVVTAKFLKAVEIAPEWRYYVKDVIEYAMTDLEGEEMAVVKVQCLDSYEHTCMIANSMELWTRVYQCRSGARVVTVM